AARAPVVTRTVSAPATVALPFAAALDGTSRQTGSAGDGRAQVDIAAQIHVAGAPLPLAVRLSGRALPGGGLRMVSSSVTLGRGAGARLLDVIEASGLGGRGGAHVSSALKLRAVAERRGRAVVVANGSESEPASRKDAVLLTHTPHLVIDGAMVAATAVGADE